MAALKTGTLVHKGEAQGEGVEGHNFIRHLVKKVNKLRNNLWMNNVL